MAMIERRKPAKTGKDRIWITVPETPARVSRVTGHKLTTDGASSKEIDASSVPLIPSSSAPQREIRVPGPIEVPGISAIVIEKVTVHNGPVTFEDGFYTN